MVADHVRVAPDLLPLGCSPFSSRAWSLGVFQRLAVSSARHRQPRGVDTASNDKKLGRQSGPFDWCELAVRRLPNRRCFRNSALLHALHNHRPRLGLQSNSSFEAPHPTNIQAATHSPVPGSLIPSLRGSLGRFGVTFRPGGALSTIWAWRCSCYLLQDAWHSGPIFFGVEVIEWGRWHDRRCKMHARFAMSWSVLAFLL